MLHDADHDGSTPSDGDQYAATASAYELFLGAYRSGQLAALETLRGLLRPEAGPILDVGAGSGANSEWVLDQLPDAQLVALEPSRAMRSLLMARVAARPEWFERITVRPEDFLSAALPPCIGGAILLGVIGHFDARERAEVLAELAARLPEDGAALIDLQAPETPARMEPFEFLDTTIGELRYRGIGEGWPVDEERMRWRMSYLTLDGETLLLEDIAEFVFHHPSPQVVAAEAARVGLRLDRLGGTTFFLLTHERTRGDGR